MPKIPFLHLLKAGYAIPKSVVLALCYTLRRLITTYYQPDSNGRSWRGGENNRNFKQALGFTLLELLVVIVIIGLLAAYVGPRYFAQIGKSERTVAKSQVDGFGRALDAYRLDVGHYPTTEQGLAALFVRPTDEPKWNGPYLQKAPPEDPWGHPYVYRVREGGAEFDLVSYGKDGQPGGDSENADVSYH